jgi:hypothetical protein
VGFLGEFISVIGELERSFRMPDGGCGIPFFVMFRGGAMGPRRAFVQLGGLAVFLMHVISSLVVAIPFHAARGGPIASESE